MFDADASLEGSGSEGNRPKSPMENASLFSKLTFSWPWALIKKGLQGPIEESDIPSILEDELSDRNRKLMEGLWEQEIVDAIDQERLPSLHRVLLRHYFERLWYMQPLIGLTSLSRIGQALSLGRLIQYFEDGRGRSEGYFWAAALIVCAIVPLFSHHQTYFRTWRMGMQLRIATVAAIYAKSLRLSSVGGNKFTTSGELFNLASNDVERFLFTSLFISYLFWAPVEAIAVLVVGLRYLGPAFAAGYVVLFTFVPAQFVLGKKFARLRSQVAAITDQRVSLVSQAISGVRVMKMSGWEHHFAHRVDKIRKEETMKIENASRFRALNEAIYFATNVSVSIVTFVVHVMTGNTLTPRDVFTTFTLINVVQFTMTKFLAYAVMSLSECYVSVFRIQQFLELPEVDDPPPSGQDADDSKQEDQEAMEPEEPQAPLISIKGVSSYWEMNLKKRVRFIRKKPRHGILGDIGSRSRSRSKTAQTTESEKSQKSVALTDISLDLEKGKLYVLVGAVGSGKSALLQTLAGELLPTTGAIERRATSIAYAPQDPWIMDGTLKENVLMGLSFDEFKYREVINACGLWQDLRSFHSGDDTIVGDRGVQCSGGQRARIGLARALYRDAELILLDDPLSAVDSKVGRLVFDLAIKDLCVRRGKCVVLATHQHQLVLDETCILMKQGSVACIGSYDECVAASDCLLKPIPHEEEEEPKIDDSESKETNKDKQKSGKNSEDNTEGNRANEETTQRGAVEFRTWVAYVEAMGGVPVIVGLLCLFAFTQAILLATIAQIGNWSELPDAEQRGSSLIFVVVGLGVAVIILAVTRATLIFSRTIRASRRLHDNMTLSVLRAKVGFFDTNPVGRILNRFSADVGSNDDQLPASLNDSVSIGFIVLGGIATAASVLPFILIVLPLLLWYFVRVRWMFVKTSRELKRFEGMARSPIFAMMSESISGVASIRANGSVDFFLHKFQKVQNAHTRAFFNFIATTRWLNFRLESVTITFLGLSSFLSVLFHDNGWFNVDPAVLGLSLTLLLQLSGLLQWAVRQSSEVINQMVAVERVAAYTKLESEAALHTENDGDEGKWPSGGQIEMKGVTVRYRNDLPPVLKNISFVVKKGQRVGIVGRTGSGKSTIVQALFRLLEAEEGTILIDGKDIASLGLHTLRTKISVIPQSPVLFSGTSLRDNLDPFGRYTNDCILQALEDVQMLRMVEELPGRLGTIVEEGGTNFSVGQRQLLCVARSILDKNQILVLDEPTANVDSRTDILLQNAVANSFPGATVIAIAHRLDTVIDFDKILVVGSGEVLEFGSPQELLSQDGHFSSMVSDTGISMSRQLRKRAFRLKPTSRQAKTV